RIQRVQDRRHRAVVDEEVRGTGSGRLAVEDLPQRLALGRVGPLVDDRLLLPVALRNFARPIEEQRPVEAAELRIVEVPLLDVARDQGLAVTVCRGRPELTRTTPV